MPIVLVNAVKSPGKSKREVMKSLEDLNKFLEKEPPGFRASQEHQENVETALNNLVQGLGSLPAGKAQLKAMDIIEKHFSYLGLETRKSIVQSADNTVKNQIINYALKKRLEKMVERGEHGKAGRKFGQFDADLTNSMNEIESKRARWKLFSSKKDRKKEDKPGIANNDFQRKLKNLQSQSTSAPTRGNQADDEGDKFLSATASTPKDEFSPESSPVHPAIHDSTEQQPVEQTVSANISETHEIHQENLENPGDGPHDELEVTSLDSQEKLKKSNSFHAGDKNTQSADDSSKATLNKTFSLPASLNGTTGISENQGLVLPIPKQQTVEQTVSANAPEKHEIHQENPENPGDSVHAETSHSADVPVGAEKQVPSEEKSAERIEQKNKNDAFGVYDEVGVTSLDFQEKLKKLEPHHAEDENTQSADANKPVIDLHKQMVINPQKHEINREKLRDLAEGLLSYFKHKGVSDVLGEPLAEKLRAQQLHLLRLANDENLDQADLGLAVRDCYKRMVKLCRCPLSRTVDNEKKELLSTLTAFFDELKRHHLSHAATPIFNKYGAKTAERIKKSVEGFGHGYAGSTLLSTKKGEVSVSISGTTTAIEIKKDDTLFMDDDNEFMYTAIGSGQAKFGYNIVDQLKGAIFGRLYKGGQYRKTTDLPSLAKVLAKDSANNPSLLQSLLLRNSAGPRARKLAKIYEKGMDAVFANTLYKKPAAPLYLPEGKVAKGAYNTSVINSHAKRIDELLKMNADGNFNLSELTKTAYPEQIDVVQSLRQAGQVPVSVMSYSPMPLLTSGTGQRGREKKTTITAIEGGAEFALRLSDGKIVGKDFGYLFDAKATLMGRRRETALERLRPMHVITSAAYTKDIRISMNLWNTFERVHKNGDKESPKLNLYRKSNNAVSEKLSADDLMPLSSQGINYFGAEIDIPEAFLGTVRAPKEKWGDLLEAVTEKLDALRQTYDNFESDVANLRLESRLTDIPDMREEYAWRRAASVLKIESAVWGGSGRYQNSAGVKEEDLVKPGSKAQLEFIADSHDAISTALGSLGTHLEILKAKLRDNQDPKLEDGEQSERDKELIEKIKKADASYTTLSKAAEASNLPVPRDPLYRYNTIAWGTVSTKNELESQLRVVMGGNLDLLPAILKKTTDRKISVDLQNDATAADFSVGCKYTQQDHPNYSRRGDFIEVVVSLGGANPLLGAVMEKSLKKAAKTMRVELPTTKESNFNRMTDILGGMALDAHKRYQVVCRWHKYSELPDNKYEFQYLKIFEQRDEGISPIVKGIPLKVKEKLVGAGSLAKKVLSPIAMLSISGRSGQDIRNPIFEFMGNDLGHHIINFNHLDRLYKAADADAKKKKAEEDGIDVKNVKVDPEAVYSSLREKLEKKENLYKKLQFFSSNSIFDVVKDYREFIDWKENGKGERPRNGFMFFDTDKIQESAKISRKAEAAAAGKGWPPAEKPSLAEPVAVPDIKALERAKKHLNALDTLKSDDTDKKQGMADIINKRIDYFLNDKDGQAIFKSYLNIITAYKEINAAGTTLHAYSSYVREKEPNMQALRKIGKTAQNTGKVLADAIQGARAIPDAAPKAEAFLREKNLFEGERKSYNEIVSTRHSEATKQTGAWLRLQKITVAQNGFAGAHGFIIAYLQQVTGRYDKLHLEEARKYLLRITNSARPTKAEMKAIVEEINRDYGMSSKHARLVTPGDEGHPVWIGDINPLRLDPEKSSPVVILRDKNANGEETFAALARKNKTEQKFDDAWPRENLEMQLHRLEKKRNARNQAIGNRPSNPTGIEIRETMKNVGELRRGVVKNVVAKIADIQRPMRETVRGLTDAELSRWITDAYEKGNENLWKEGMKEKKKREEMMALLENGGVLSIRNERVDRTGKELREIKDAVDLRESDYSRIARFKKKVSSIMPGAGNKLNKDAELMTRLSRQELKDLMVPWHITEEGEKAGSGLTGLLGAATKERKEREDLAKAIKKKLDSDEDIESISLKDLHQWKVKSREKRNLRMLAGGETTTAKFFSSTDGSTKTTLQKSYSLPRNMGSTASETSRTRAGHSASSGRGSSDIHKFARAAHFAKNLPMPPVVPDSPKKPNEDLSSESAEVGSVSYSVSDLQLDLIPPRGKRKPSKGVISAAPIIGEVPSSGKKTGASNQESGGRSGDGEATERIKTKAVEQFEKDRAWDKTQTSKDWTSEHLAHFAKGTGATNSWFARNNYQVVENNGDQNNCLILSLLQHATGRYDIESLEELKRWATEIRNDMQLAENEMLGAALGYLNKEDSLINRLVTKISKKTGNEKFTLDSLFIVAPNANLDQGGLPHPVSEGMEIKQRKMIVYGRGGAKHYEAVREIKEG